MVLKRQVRLAISTMVLGAVLAGCGVSPFAGRTSVRSASNKDIMTQSQNIALSSDDHLSPNFVAAADDARQAQLMIEKGKSAEAIGFAEAAVLAAPHSGEYRLILAQSYMMDGRFSAAASAYEDARELTEFQNDQLINYALAKIAEGDRAGAVQWLAQHADRLPPSDLGLALALAGDHDGALFVLGDAARRGDASAQTRQNLSLALAFAGRWAQASLVASQDLPMNRVKKRMLDFSALASISDKSAQIANLMGIKRRGDGAMPARLALVNFPRYDSGLSIQAVPDYEVKAADGGAVAAGASAAELAAAQGAASYDMAWHQLAMSNAQAPTEQGGAVADAGANANAGAGTGTGTDASTSSAAVPALGAMPTRVAHDGARPVVRDRAAAATSLTPLVADALFADQERGQAIRANVSAPWSVQLGSLSSAAGARRYWGELKQHSRLIADYAASSHRAVVGGRVYYRLTLDGMESQRQAQALCNRLQAENKACFVRRLTGREQVQWSANGRGMKLASR